MPHIEQEIANCVFYVYGPDTKTGELQIIGTGFVVSRPSTTLPGLHHYYAVTNQHVFRDSDRIRVNTSDGSVRYLELDQTDWLVKPSFDDLSVCDITDQLSADSDQVSAVTEEGFLVEDQSYFGMGDEVFMVGLFADAPGSIRNYPKARFGNISALASAVEVVEQPHGIKRPTHLVDMHSRTGFSGSPVFVFDTPHHIWSDDRWTLKLPNKGGLIKLFGVHCGQFGEWVSVRMSSDRSSASGEAGSDDLLVDGERVRLPSSMNTVVPAWRITEMLNDPALELIRNERDKTRRPEHDQWPKPEAH